jgi:hypothetical protein
VVCLIESDIVKLGMMKHIRLLEFARMFAEHQFGKQIEVIVLG